MNKIYKLVSIFIILTLLSTVVTAIPTANLATPTLSTNEKGQYHAYVYVTNSGETRYDIVSVIDTLTNKVIADVRLNVNPVDVTNLPYISGIIANPNGKEVYVSIANKDKIYVINTLTNKVTNNIEIKNPSVLVMNHAGTRLYVLNSTGVISIDTKTKKIISKINIRTDIYTDTFMISSDETKLYVDAWQNNTPEVDIINIATGNIIKKVELNDGGLGVNSFVLNSEGTKLYVATRYQVTVIDTKRDKITNTINGLNNIYAMNINPIKPRLYVTSGSPHYGHSLYVIDTGLNKVMANPIQAGIYPNFQYPGDIAVSPNGKNVYVSNGKNVSVIDAASNTVINNASIGDWVNKITISNVLTYKR